MISWSGITKITGLQQLSSEKIVLIFKHSPRCPISVSMKNRLERHWTLQDEDIFETILVDVLTEGDFSQQIASYWQIPHASPQMILLHQGKVLYVAEHLDIDYETLKQLPQFC